MSRYKVKKELRRSRNETDLILRKHLPEAIDKGLITVEADCKSIGSTTGDNEKDALGALLVLTSDSERSELLICYEPMTTKTDYACAQVIYDIFEEYGIEHMKQRVPAVTDAGQGSYHRSRINKNCFSWPWAVLVSLLGNMWKSYSDE